MNIHLDYSAHFMSNREVFLLNYGPDCRAFEAIIENFHSTFSRVGKERDTQGHSHAGLVLFTNIFVRHAVLGFQHFASYQSFTGWYVFRPGIEAFLILGKLIDNPQNAKVWKNRRQDHKAYKKTFSGTNLVSGSLPRGSEFRKVLGRLNDEFMHPNPDFTYRDVTIHDQGKTVLVNIEYFDKKGGDHEAHLLAYLNLLDCARLSSLELINNLCGPPKEEAKACPVYAELNRERASRLAKSDPQAKKVLEELGL